MLIYICQTLVYICQIFIEYTGLPQCCSGEESACNAGDSDNMGLKIPGGASDNPLQHSSLEKYHGQRSLQPSPQDHRVRHDSVTEHTQHAIPRVNHNVNDVLWVMIMCQCRSLVITNSSLQWKVLIMGETLHVQQQGCMETFSSFCSVLLGIKTVLKNKIYLKMSPQKTFAKSPCIKKDLYFHC